MLARQITLLDPLPNALTPLLRYSCKLFRAPENIISIVIKQIQTLSAKHPGYGIPPLPSPSGVPAKSFIYRFYADCPANSFIYRIYAKHTGWGVPPFRRSDVQICRHHFTDGPYPFRYACTARLLRRTSLLATIAEDAPTPIACAARLPSGQVEIVMATINRQELDHLERRELQLTIVAAVFVFVLASGLAVFMYPMVFVHADTANKWTLRVAFFGFCALTLLFIGYLLDRQRTVRKLKQQILEELERNIELRLQASADLLHTMPDINHFWDRLTMEYRRAMTMQRNLTLLVVKAKLGASPDGDHTSALGDAAKAMSRKLRPTDSIYRLAPEIFGLVLPETDTLNAKRIAVRLQEELQAVRAKHGGLFETSVHNYPENAQSSHELEDIVKSLLPVKEDYAVPVNAPAPAKA